MAERHMVPMHEQPVRPTPPGGYRTRFGEAGPQDATEVTLTDVDERGFEVDFTAFGVSSANRLRHLLMATVNHFGSEEGQRGFVHPVIVVTPGHYFHQAQGREIWHFDYTIVDWMKDDGTLLSKAPVAPQIDGGNGGGATAAEAPWETADA